MAYPSVYFASVWILLAQVSGCTWQAPLVIAEQIPDKIRISDSIELHNLPRWQLAPGSSFSVGDDGSVPITLVEAVRTGLGRQFSLQTQDADYHIMVDWPEEIKALPVKQISVSAGLLGMSNWPRAAKTQSFNVYLKSRDGYFQRRVGVRVAPKLWAQDWSSATYLEVAFAELAQALTGR